MNSPKLDRTKAEVPGQRNRVQPEFCRLVAAIHVDMGRLVRLVAVVSGTALLTARSAHAQYLIALTVKKRCLMPRGPMSPHDLVLVTRDRYFWAHPGGAGRLAV